MPPNADSTDFEAPDEVGTVPIAVAMQVLRLKRSQVANLLDDPAVVLAGPPPPGRGSKPREVYTHTLAKMIAERQVTAPAAFLAELEQRVTLLETTMGDDRSAGTEREVATEEALRQRVRVLEYALAKSRAANDALRDAAESQQKAADLRSQATAHDAAALLAVRRAEKLQDAANVE